MKLHAAEAPGKEPRGRTVKAGSVTVRIYENTNRGKACFTVYWRVGGRSERKVFFDSAQAQRFAKRQAEALAVGNVQTPGISPAEVESFREAQRHLAALGIPPHVAARE